uniref:uncharacterized protein LOC124050057 isoform X3 n=1 Tax=Scatophagus argus TaxID=75038 RepID=UPI001ED7DCA5|nr:uncharacterized protein LOC124050057 isoform X3 [Scatophagus argus]XP_046228160.1 uncharacterized protein LOC124050057 isoform X3 [Scatophagus argus]
MSCLQLREAWTRPHGAGEKMKSGLLLLILSVSGISVSAAVLSAEREQVTKRDGETVTLHINKTTDPLKNYLWNYGPQHSGQAPTLFIVTNREVTVVNGTRFGNRLHIDVETGSITISNLTTKDTGVFQVQIFTKNNSLAQNFNLTVQDNNVIPVNVLVGNNVTLDPGVKQLQKEHKVFWTLGEDCSGKLIAHLKNFEIFIEESFKDVLQLKSQTGALSIIGVTKNHTGFYCVTMLLGYNLREQIKYSVKRQYSVRVFEPVSEPHVSRDTTRSLNDGSCSIVCSEKNAPEVTLAWYSGGWEINHTSNSDVCTNLTLPLEIQSQHEANYSCEATNPASRKTVSVDSTQWCPPHSAGITNIGIVLAISVPVAALVVVLVVVVCVCKRRRRKEATDCFCMRNMAQETPPQNNQVSEGSSEATEEQGLLLNG